MRQIEQQQGPSAAAKTLDYEFQEPAAHLTDRKNPAHKIAGIVPALERAGAAAARDQHESVRGESPGDLRLVPAEPGYARFRENALWPLAPLETSGHGRVRISVFRHFFLRRKMLFELFAVAKIGRLGHPLGVPDFLAIQ